MFIHDTPINKTKNLNYKKKPIELCQIGMSVLKNGAGLPLGPSGHNKPTQIKKEKLQK